MGANVGWLDMLHLVRAQNLLKFISSVDSHCISNLGTPKIYTTTGFGPRKNREVAGVDDLVVHTPNRPRQQFRILSKPKPGGGVYLWGPNIEIHFIC